jgi:hypothetical protein
MFHVLVAMYWWQPFVLSLQELVGCHYGQWSILSKSRASNGAVETASSQMQQQEQSLQDDHFCMGRAAPNLDVYRPNSGSQMQTTGMYGKCRLQAISSNPNLLRCGKILDLKDHLYAGREGKWPSWALGTESNVSVSIASFSYAQLHNMVAPFDLHLVLLEGNLARQVLPFNILPGGVSSSRG